MERRDESSIDDAQRIIGDELDITTIYGAGVAGSDAYILGNDLVADVVPEPATLGLLAILGLAFLRRK